MQTKLLDACKEHKSACKPVGKPTETNLKLGTGLFTTVGYEPTPLAAIKPALFLSYVVIYGIYSSHYK